MPTLAEIVDGARFDDHFDKGPNGPALRGAPPVWFVEWEPPLSKRGLLRKRPYQAPQIIIELPALEAIAVIDCRDCKRTGRPTGRLVGRQVVREQPAWHVEWRCARCEVVELIGAGSIDDLGRAIAATPASTDALVAQFVADVAARGL